MDTVEYTKKCRGLSLISGGLDSQLAVCVLRDAGADVEAVTFETPFFSSAAGLNSAAPAAIAASAANKNVFDFTVRSPLVFPCIQWFTFLYYAFLLRR